MTDGGIPSYRAPHRATKAPWKWQSASAPWANGYGKPSSYVNKTPWRRPTGSTKWNSRHSQQQERQSHYLREKATAYNQRCLQGASQDTTPSKKQARGERPYRPRGYKKRKGHSHQNRRDSVPMKQRQPSAQPGSVHKRPSKTASAPGKTPAKIPVIMEIVPNVFFRNYDGEHLGPQVVLNNCVDNYTQYVQDFNGKLGWRQKDAQKFFPEVNGEQVTFDSLGSAARAISRMEGIQEIYNAYAKDTEIMSIHEFGGDPNDTKFARKMFDKIRKAIASYFLHRLRENETTEPFIFFSLTKVELEN